jgi:DNA-binding transcriptional ArsR family regulator
MDIEEKLNYIRTHYPEGAEKLARLLGKKDTLKSGNVYGEKLTDRQFSLVFNPLLEAAFERGRILEALAGNESTIGDLSTATGMKPQQVFNHMKDLLKRNVVEISEHAGRDAIFRKIRR